MNKQYLDYEGLDLYADKILNIIGNSGGSNGSNTPADLEKAPLFSITTSLKDLEKETDGKWVSANGRNLNPTEYPDLLNEVGFPYGTLQYNGEVEAENYRGQQTASYLASLESLDDEHVYSFMATSESSGAVQYLVIGYTYLTSSGELSRNRADINYSSYVIDSTVSPAGIWLHNGAAYYAFVTGTNQNRKLKVIKIDIEASSQSLELETPAIGCALSNFVKRGNITYIGGFIGRYTIGTSYEQTFMLLSCSDSGVSINFVHPFIEHTDFTILNGNKNFILGDYFYYIIQESLGNIIAYKTNILTLETSVEESKVLKPFMDASRYSLNSSIVQPIYADREWYSKNGDEFLYSYWKGTASNPKAYTVYLVGLDNDQPIIKNFVNIVADNSKGGDPLISYNPYILGLINVGNKLYLARLITATWSYSNNRLRGMLAELSGKEESFRYMFDYDPYTGVPYDIQRPLINTLSYNWFSCGLNFSRSGGVSAHFNMISVPDMPNYISLPELFSDNKWYGKDGSNGGAYPLYYIKVKK